MRGALKPLSKLLRDIHEGVKAANEGRVRPWDEVEKELFPREEKD